MKNDICRKGDRRRKNIPPKTWTVTRKDSAAIRGEKKNSRFASSKCRHTSEATNPGNDGEAHGARRNSISGIRRKRETITQRHTHTHSLHNGTKRALWSWLLAMCSPVLSLCVCNRLRSTLRRSQSQRRQVGRLLPSVHYRWLWAVSEWMNQKEKRRRRRRTMSPLGLAVCHH